jgi:hypothetical protein
MPNTNPQAVKIANERFRPYADRLAQAYHFCNAFKSQIAAEGIDTLFSADDKDLLSDGSLTDGRTPITNADVKGLINSLDQFIAFMDGDPVTRDLLLRVSPNPLRF